MNDKPLDENDLHAEPDDLAGAPAPDADLSGDVIPEDDDE